MRSAYHLLQVPIYAPKHRRAGSRALQTWSLRFEALERRDLLSAAAVAQDALTGAQPAAALSTASIPQAAAAAAISFSGFQGQSTEQTGTVNIAFNGTPAVEQSSYGATVALGNLGSWQSPGDPTVPVETVTLLLPPGTSISAANVQYAGAGIPVAENVPLAAMPQPTQAGGSAAASDAAPPLPSPSFAGDSGIAFSNSILAGYHLGMVQVFPVHYDADTQTTLFYPNVSIQVQTSTSPDTSQDGVHPLASDTQQVEAMVANPQEVTAYDVSTGSADAGPVTMASSSSSLPSGGPYSYVIITDAALAPSFQPLINQKIADGLTATIVTTNAYGNYSGIYANFTGTESHTNDPMGAAGLEADQIRQFIADAYANWGTRWVLLGGDTSVIPMRTVYADADGQAIDDTLPTDEYYACPNGPWDSSGDPYWGETDDGAGGGEIDLMPEVYVGRAPVENASETTNFVDKTIQNETTRSPNPDTSLWLADQLNPDTDAGVVNQDIINAVLPASWNTSSNLTSYDVSPNSWGNGYGETNIVSLLNAGPTVVNSVGHSNATDDSGITVSDVAGLTNSFPYFMYSTGCEAGAMNQADPCIAAEQVDAVHAALGVVMNTQLGWYVSGDAVGLKLCLRAQFLGRRVRQRDGEPGPGECVFEGGQPGQRVCGWNDALDWLRDHALRRPADPAAGRPDRRGPRHGADPGRTGRGRRHGLPRHEPQWDPRFRHGQPGLDRRAGEDPGARHV